MHPAGGRAEWRTGFRVCCGCMELALLTMPHWTLARLLLVGLPAYLVIYGLVMYFRERWVERRTRDWPRTTATVATVTTREFSAARGGSRTELTVHYGYAAPAAQKGFYTTTRSARPSAEALQALVGREFMVRYNAANHGESVVLRADRPI